MERSLALLEEKVFGLIEKVEELRRQLREKEDALTEARESLRVLEETRHKEQLRLQKIVDTLENLGV
ncbi:MAG TPA: hypothetical protein PLF44_08365 [Candidatus Mcinerneyibacteriales bacterium]|jgi:septal ring factor EnvC (AmiA/AmiB activator)|nr:hypothetical protein [Candidatus Mcinerneyibacteriota bacterium]HOO60409.1 hypothetical protein [Candidatus Mcinerneyibacteriales bacterium]HPE21061.1 hypothetical protein [Candidatus Mcinerneyibacteriales bacterium]HPJ70881.1 hypothetical protein [Candidatus Mcinerneyibacteriales bacterium]HPQ89975.1 hypothetical protein [Candidatus Mcinerneyibacteriales bacterium]